MTGPRASYDRVVERQVPVSRRVLRVAIAVLVSLPFAAAAAQGSRPEAGGLFITFRPGPQRITVTLPGGAPVRTPSGR